MKRLTIFVAALVVSLAAANELLAQNAGQADLDMATELQLTAETLGELERVIKLAEGALEKGLEAGQADFAKKLLGATLFQHASRHAASVFEQTPPDPRWPIIRQQALKDLEKAKRYSPALPDIYLLEAKFQVLPGGDRKVSEASLGEAIKLLKEKGDRKQLAAAHILRAQIIEDNDRKLADFEAALTVDPTSAEARQALALLYLEKGDDEKAIAELQKLVEHDANNPGVLALFANALTNLKKFDQALDLSDKLIKLRPKSSIGYNLRARVKVMKEDFKGAIKDLDEAISINADDVEALLMRSRLHAAEGNDDLAKADVEKALRRRPELPDAIITRSMLAARKENWAEAIADMQLLLQTDPTNHDYRLRLATYLVGDKRPRKAIETLTTVIEATTGDTDKDTREIRGDALRSRGDALLSVGRHGDAIKDYEEALTIDAEDTGVLNNLAWVLATSPEDGVRNAERSLVHSLKACELTKYARPHILSTLAAGYAEKGDWETAIKWSSKAVELGTMDNMIDDQLKKELDSYKEKKAWREKQEIEENTKPLGVKAKSNLET